MTHSICGMSISTPAYCHCHCYMVQEAGVMTTLRRSLM
jgi:hypothetical protein